MMISRIDAKITQLGKQVLRPLTLVAFGFFLLVINALMIMMVSRLVKGFKVSSFWTAFFASIFVSILSIVIDAVLPDGGSVHRLEMPHSGLWL